MQVSRKYSLSVCSQRLHFQSLGVNQHLADQDRIRTDLAVKENQQISRAITRLKTKETADPQRPKAYGYIRSGRKGKQWPRFSLAWQGDATYNPE
jgi:hypothetical protein